MIDAAIAVIAFLFGATVAYLFSQRTVVGSLRTQAEELLNLRQQNADITAKLGRAEERASLTETLVKERDIARDQSVELRAQLAELETARQLAVSAQQNAESQLLQLQDRHVKEIAQLREDHQLAQARFEQRLQEQLRESQDSLKDTFQNMAGQVVQKAQEDFIKVSEAKADDDLTKRQRSIQQLLEPITKELEEVKKISQTIDKERHASFEMLGSGIQTIQKETERLANALRKPQSRGAWGEMQLELTLTNAGLVEGQDFSKHDSTTGDEGLLRSFQRDGLALADGQWREVGHHFGANSAEVGITVVQLGQRLDLSHPQQLVDDVGHVADIAAQSSLGRAVIQGIEVGSENGQRCPEFVGGASGEVTLDAQTLGKPIERRVDRPHEGGDFGGNLLLGKADRRGLG